MAKNFDLNALYKAARASTKPAYNKIRKMDADDWLASVGLERRNVGTDVAGAFGFVLLGCAIGVGIGFLLAPKAGNEIRQDLNRKFKQQAEQFNKNVTAPTYAS